MLTFLKIGANTYILKISWHCGLSKPYQLLPHMTPTTDYGHTMAKFLIPNSAQIVCSSPNVWDVDEKRLLWVSVVRDLLGQPPCLIQNQARRKVRKFGEGCQGIVCWNQDATAREIKVWNHFYQILVVFEVPCLPQTLILLLHLDFQEMSR